MSIIKSILRKALSSRGYNIYKRDIIPCNQKSMSAGLERMKLLNIYPDTIIDVGAAQGTWTEKALILWPSAKYELVEPLIEQTAILNELKSKYSNINYHSAVAGEEPGETWLNVSSDLDGSGIYGIKGRSARKVPIITIDEIVKNTSGTIMIKLDTHGYEVPILKGSVEALKRTSLLVIEVYGFFVSPTCLLFHELSAYLDKLGFRMIDLVDIMRRPGDQAFWQADAFFIRKENAVFERNSYV